MNKILAIFVIALSFLSIGCTERESLDEKEQDDVKVEESSTLSGNDIIFKKYNEVDKSKLEYTIVQDDMYYYESEASFVGSGLIGEINSIDDKK